MFMAIVKTGLVNKCKIELVPWVTQLINGHSVNARKIITVLFTL